MQYPNMFILFGGFHKWGYPKIEGLYWKSYLVNLFQSYLVLTVLVLSLFSSDINM